jgi:ubiquinone/menaquinone biosynthesis C-methylase UbiE
VGAKGGRVSGQLALGKPAGFGDFVLGRRLAVIDALGPFRGGRLLDVGCGNGAQTLRMLDRFEAVVGLDVVPAHLETLQHSLPPGANCSTALYDGGAMPFADASFAAALSIETLEHVADEARTLAEIYRVLAPGGVLVLSVPNKWWVFETHGARLPLLPWNRVPFFSWLPPALHRRWARARIYRRRDIVQSLRAAGFAVEGVRYLTAPMDAARPRWLGSFLRHTLFAGASTPVPVLATSIFVRARRPRT